MRIIVMTCLLFISTALSAQVNKCIDPSGKVVGYGSECPPGSRPEKMAIQKGAAPSAAPAQKSLAEQDADFRKRQMQKQEQDQKDAKKTAEAENRHRACEQSQAYLKSLESGQRITRTDPKTGERVFLQDNEYSGEISKARAAVASNCK